MSARTPQPGLYRHYKGGLYTLLCVARHSETGERLVTYRCQADGSYWVRPLAMWMETIGGTQRFAPYAAHSPASRNPN